MPRKLAHAVHVGRHERHDLRLARELILILLFLAVLAHGSFGLGIWGVVRGLSRSRGGDVLAHERLGEEDGVELHADAHLEGGGGNRPQLTRDCYQSQIKFTQNQTGTHLNTE